MAMITPERDLEAALVTKLRDLKYEYRPDIRDRATLEQNFREKFEALKMKSAFCPKSWSFCFILSTKTCCIA